MNEIEVISLVLSQVEDIRVPIKYEDMRQQLLTIHQNLEVLREEFIKNREKPADEAAEVTEDV